LGLLEQLSSDFGIHQFFAAIHLVVRGKLTRNQLENMFQELTLESRADLDMLQANFTSLNNRDKDLWYNDLKAVVYLLEDRRISKLEAKTLLGL